MYQFFRQGGNTLCLYFVLFLVISVASCVPAKKYVYFNNLKERDTIYPHGIVVVDSLSKFQDPKIEVNDLLSVDISVFNPLDGDQSITPVKAAGNDKGALDTRYLVDKDGYIELRMVGFVKVVGLTTSEAREVIKQKAKEFYKDPIVNVRITNFEVTVQGEVSNPGIFNVQSEKASILDILALAGDLRATAKRDNILIARTENNKVTFARVNITTSDIYKSPYFYMKQRDYIYVEPNAYTRQSTDNTYMRLSGYIAPLVSIFSILVITKAIRIY
jgi:polysaccharide export outer membrane protein